MPLPTRDYDRTVNSEVERILYQISVVRQEFAGLLDGLDEEQFHWSPSRGAWSIGQCLEHLNVSNRQFLPSYEEAVRKAKSDGILGDGPYSYSWLSRYMFRITQPPVKKKFRAPKRFRPGPRRTMAEVVAEWNKSHDALENVVREASGIDLERVRVASPVTGLIRFNLGMAFWIQTAHDRRHLWQAREVRNRSDFPA